MKHYSVMCNEIINSLNIKEDGIYVDATLGYGGMSGKILERLNNKGLLIGIDQDVEAREYSKELLKKIGSNFKVVEGNFKDIKKIIKELGIDKVDGIIYDLGFSSPQVDDEKRGFSFMKDSLLDMRMDLSNKLNAKKVVNEYKESELIKCFFEYGEEKLSRIIAKEIVRYREDKEIESTLELVEIIKNSVGANYFYKNHPERKIFQAIRIEVNNEIEVLKVSLPDAIDLLNKEGRLSVITFHSLEDKIVKDIFKKYSEVNDIFKGLPNIPSEYKPKIKIINKKVIVPSDKEIEENSRSKSAKLRIIERV